METALPYIYGFLAVFAAVVMGWVAVQTTGIGGIRDKIDKLVTKESFDTIKNESLSDFKTSTNGKLEKIREESESAHSQIGKNIKKSSKKAKKRRQELENRMNNRFDELSRQIEELGNSSNNSNSNNQ